MTRLTHVAIATRKVIRWGLFFAIFLIIGKVSLDIGVGVYRHYFPEPPPPPTLTFGRLPRINFPVKDRPAITQLRVETPTGDLPTLPLQAKVYFMPKLSPTLLSLDNARSKARTLGFDVEESVSETVYRFSNQTTDSRIEINIVSGAFSISTNLASDPVIVDLRAPAPEIAATQIRSFLSAAELLPADLTGSTEHEFLKVEDRNLIGAISLSEANFTKINFFRKSFENMPSLTANTKQSNVWFIVSGSRERGKQIIAGQYQYFPVDEQRFATYPIKTAEIALNELNGGGGYIASPGNNPNGMVTIRKIYLAYFDPNVPSDFYQPVVAFEGDNGFLAFVPAVTADYYGE